MKISDLEELARQGKLVVTKDKWRVVKRCKGWRGQKWDDQTNPSWDNTLISYQTYFYKARTLDMPENEAYKITKRDYELLKSLLV